MTTEDHVRHEVDGRLSRIVLDRPEAANRIHSTMMRQLIDALAAATAAGSDVVLITAAGRDFSVGRDQHEVLPEGMTKLDHTQLIVVANRLLTGSFSARGEVRNIGLVVRGHDPSSDLLGPI